MLSHDENPGLKNTAGSLLQYIKLRWMSWMWVKMELMWLPFRSLLQKLQSCCQTFTAFSQFRKRVRRTSNESLLGVCRAWGIHQCQMASNVLVCDTGKEGVYLQSAVWWLLRCVLETYLKNKKPCGVCGIMFSCLSRAWWHAATQTWSYIKLIYRIEHVEVSYSGREGSVLFLCESTNN